MKCKLCGGPFNLGGIWFWHRKGCANAGRWMGRTARRVALLPLVPK